MFALLLGVLLLVTVVQVLRWFAHADIKTVRKAINWGGGGLIVVVIAFLAATGRIGGAVAGLMALAAWGLRIMSMLHMGRQFSGMFRSFRFGQGGAGRGAAGQASQVETAFLSMSLDLASGAMDGEVKQGKFQGRRLQELAQSDLLVLLREVQGDADSLGLLEAYLDRAHPDWRDAAGAEGTSTGSSGPQGAMTANEAYRILGLKPGADGGVKEGEVKAAYRRLMGQLHPDHGGSDYLAAKVNQAKDFLLKKRGV